MKHIDCPPHLQPPGTYGSSWSPDVVWARAQAWNRHPLNQRMEISAWIVLYLMEKAGLVPETTVEGSCVED